MGQRYYDNVNYQHVRKARVALTNAQVLRLPTVPIELVPPPGVGFAIIPMSAVLQLVWVANYTNIDADAQLLIGLSAASGDQVLVKARENPDGFVSSILAAGATFTVFGQNVYMDAATHPEPAAFFGPNDFENQPLEIYMNNSVSSDIEDGDPDNSLIVTVFYSKVELD